MVPDRENVLPAPSLASALLDCLCSRACCSVLEELPLAEKAVGLVHSDAAGAAQSQGRWLRLLAKRRRSDEADEARDMVEDE